jgi:hypothetical protein
MADESSSYDVNIRTTADESGVDQTNAGLDSVDQKAAAINERQASLAAQKEAISAKQLAALQAEALGETEIAAALEREVALRRLALELQEQSAISESEALAIAQARSAEEDKVYGKAGKFKLLQNFGIDANTTRTLGIAAFAGFQLQQYITEAAKHYDEMRITGEKESAELEKQVQSWKEMAASAKDLNDIGKLQESITQHAREQIEKLRTLPAEGTKGFFQNAADSTIIWNNALLRAIGVQKQFKTSTDEAADALSSEISAQARAGEVFTNSARKNAEAIRAIAALPYPEALAKARSEIQRLGAEQDTLNRSDEKQEATWQRKQAQINQLATTIAQLTDRQELLTKQEDLTRKIALESDPEKRSALQGELDQLNVKLLLQKQIQDATDRAAKSGKGLSDAERKAIEDQIGPLSRKVQLLREAADLASGSQKASIEKQIEALTGAKAPDDSLKNWLKGITAEAGYSDDAIKNAQRQLEALDAKAKQLAIDQKLAEAGAIKDQSPAKPQQPLSTYPGLHPYGDAESIGQGADEIGKAVADAAGKLKAGIDGAVSKIEPAFGPVSTSIDGIAKAIDDGVGQLAGAVTSSVSGIVSSFSRKAADLQKQIDAIRSNL